MAQQAGRTFTAGKNDAGRRVDRVCRKLLEKQLPLSAIYSGIRKGVIRVNGKKVKPSYLLQEKDKLLLPETFSPEDKSEAPADIDIASLKKMIIYENDHILVFDKPSGLLTHGNNSLQEMVEGYLFSANQESLSFSPAPLHRLDRNTSGLVVFGKSIEGSRKFSELLRAKKVIKAYLGVHHGVIPEARVWEDTLSRDKTNRRSSVAKEGKQAVLSVYPLRCSRNYGLALFVPQTGRTHQIRVQSSARGYPLAGDRKYGGGQVEGHLLLLHACMLFFKERDPIIRREILYAPPPVRFRAAAETLMPGFGLESCYEGLQNEIKKKISSISGS